MRPPTGVMPAAPSPHPADFARRFSMEATRPDASEIARLAAILPPGTEVYVTAVPTVGSPSSGSPGRKGSRSATVT